jgi:hypothetical protein
LPVSEAARLQRLLTCQEKFSALDPCVGDKVAFARLLQSAAILIGTSADALWAIRFYEKIGFRLVGHGEKDYLLMRYWNIGPRQTETSVVLAGKDWQELSGRDLAH